MPIIFDVSLQENENKWKMVTRKKSIKKMVYTVPCNQVILSNKFASLEDMEHFPGSMKGPSTNKSRIKSRVNKSFTEYQPTWLISPVQAKRYPRKKQHTTRNLVDINALELKNMHMIKASPHLSEYQRK